MARARLPNEFFRLIPSLYPHFAEILTAVELSGPEFFVLSFVRHSGQKLDDGEIAMPISQIKEMLVKVGFYSSTSGAHGFITGDLQNANRFLKHRRLTPEEKATYFPDSAGYRDVVVITEIGEAKLEAVNDYVDRFFSEATSGISWVLLRPALAAFARIASPLIRRVEEMAGWTKR